MKKRLYTMMAVGFMGACLAFGGCAGGMGSRYTYYENATHYAVGDISLPSERVFDVEIDWTDGEIEIERRADGQLRIYEETTLEDEEAKMHYFLDHGVVKVQYCASGYRGKIDGTQKRLLVEIPQGLNLEIESVRAEISIGVVELNSFSVENRFGALSAERISCQRVETETTSGSVRIGELSAKSCSLESKTGDITLGLTGTIDAELETQRGNISLYPHGVCMQIDFQTRGGRVVTEREYERKGSIYEFSCLSSGEQTRDGKLCLIEVETTGGDLRVY